MDLFDFLGINNNYNSYYDNDDNYSDEEKFNDLYSLYEIRNIFFSTNCSLTTLKGENELIDINKFDKMEAFSLGESMKTLDEEYGRNNYLLTVKKYHDSSKENKVIFVVGRNNDTGILCEILCQNEDLYFNDILKFNLKDIKEYEMEVNSGLSALHTEIKGINSDGNVCTKHQIIYSMTEKTIEELKSFDIDREMLLRIMNDVFNFNDCCLYEVIETSNEKKEVCNKLNSKATFINIDFLKKLHNSFKDKKDLDNFIEMMLKNRKIEYDDETIYALNYYNENIFGLDKMMRFFKEGQAKGYKPTLIKVD